jgi:siroheme decarboxylase
MLILQPLDTELLNLLQSQVPFVDRPFQRLAEQLGSNEADVLARLKRLKNPESPEKPVIRQISAIFDSKSLGYQTALVAARVEDTRIAQAAAIISAHPGVSHNYQRNHAFNLWYTLAVPPDSKLGVEETVDILHNRSGALSTRILPTVRLFKIGVKFDMSAEGDISARAAPAAHHTPSPNEIPLTDRDKDAIRVLQQDLPLVPEPFKLLATQVGMTVTDLLNHAQEFIDRKIMRRFAAVLKHREAGISANAMGVWAVPPESQESFGQFAATFSAVSHCYARTIYPDWPYSVFTMVHATSREQCETLLKRISIETGIHEYAALYSTTEFKKVRVKYFTPAITAWETTC